MDELSRPQVDELAKLSEEIYEALRGEVRKKCGRLVDRSVVISQIYLVLRDHPLLRNAINE